MVTDDLLQAAKRAKKLLGHIRVIDDIYYALQIAIGAAEWQTIDEDTPRDEEMLVAHLFDDGSSQQSVAWWRDGGWVAWSGKTVVILDPQPTHCKPLGPGPTP